MKLSNEIKAPLDSARAVLARREKILAETEKANADLAAGEAKLQQALEALSTQEAAVALGETSAADSRLRKVVRDCRDDSEAASARIRGLQTALASNDTEILKANEALAAAYEQFFVATLEAYSSELKSAAAAFLPAARKGIAIFRAFGRFSALEGLVIPDPRRESEPLVPVLNRVHTAAGGWSDDVQPDATVASIRSAAEELAREARRISAERESAARAQAEAEAGERLASGPKYSARQIDYSGAPKHYDPSAERRLQTAAKPN